MEGEEEEEQEEELTTFCTELGVWHPAGVFLPDGWLAAKCVTTAKSHSTIYC